MLFRLKQFLRKQKVQVLLGLLFIMFFGSIPSASAMEDPYDNVEHIKNFDVALTVQADSTVRVQEMIEYHFISEKHGIFRDIPVKYADRFGRNKNLVIDEVSVTDLRGTSYPFSLSTQGVNTQIKIGDPKVFITGDHVYNISYRVRNALGYFDGFDELYWNATGNEWPVPIRSASVKMTLPVPLAWSDWRLACYVGSFGSTVSCGNKEDVSPKYSSEELVQHIQITYATSVLDPGEGITVAFGFPKGLVTQPTWSDRFFLFIGDNPIILLPFLVFGGMFTHWYRRGRDPEGRGVIIPEYDMPNDLSVLEVAGLMQNRISAKDISAAIIDLAVHKYLTIEKTVEKKLFFDSEEYTFHRLEKVPAQGSIEEKLLDAVFSSQTASVKLSDLKNKFYLHISSIEAKTFEFLVTKKYFVQSPKKVLLKYGAIGIGLIAAMVIFGFIQSVLGVSMIIISAVIYFTFTWLMPRVTHAGALKKDYILGLKEYLQIAEKNRLEFHNAPAKTPDLFEKLLPVAMILGVTALWVKEFEDIYLRSPEWYSGPSGTNFSVIGFGSTLDSFSTLTASSLASTPGGSSGSGGGGFSGGGGGGGGGGSW